MRIQKDRFCSLARAKDFQQFLRDLSPELYEELIMQLQLGESCSSNKKKMSEIYASIKSKGLEDKLFEFMVNRYPHMVVKDNNYSAKAKTNKTPSKLTTKKISGVSIDDLYEKMNHHKVFEIYKPRILFIPQRNIIVGPSREYVHNETMRFIQNRLDVDYIILEGPELWHSYIEYFDKTFIDHIKGIDESKRQIMKYRKKHGLNRGRIPS